MKYSTRSQKQSLECLRLESACKELAGGVSNAKLRLHFLRMVRFWSDLATESLDTSKTTDMAGTRGRAA